MYTLRKWIKVNTSGPQDQGGRNPFPFPKKYQTAAAIEVGT